MQLPSQLDAISIIKQLENLENSGEISPSNTLSEDILPDSSSSWLISQLKGAFELKTPALYPFPNSSKELFSWVERNNQIAEESLRSLLLEEGKIEEIKESLKEYSEDIPTPKQIKLKTPTPIDQEFLLLGAEEENIEKATPSCFIWKWDEFCVFVAPQEFDFNQINQFYPELKSSEAYPDAFILMPYSSNPLESIDPCMGNELWHNFPPQYPLIWEETKVYLESLRCAKALKDSMSKRKH